MAYELIITEKPSSAKKIAEALAQGMPVRKTQHQVAYYELSANNRDVVVAPAVGHLFTVAEKNKSFTYPSFDVEWRPTFEVEKGADYSRKYLRLLTALAKKADSFTVATDFDIEGETIGYNIVRFACNKDDAQRMKFSTVTKQDLQAAYERKHASIDWGQANAGITRHEMDWLYGINLSRALTLALKRAGTFHILSSGRVQGPALKILVEREKEIAAFTPEPYWQLRLVVASQGRPIEAWHERDRFTEKGEADAAFAACQGHDAFVESIERAQFRQAPPIPFDLGSLQAEAYRCFSIPPKRTLEIAQSLYSAGLTSYPRTSSQKLPPEIGYKRILSQLASQQAYAELTRGLLARSQLKPNNGNKTDPAHPAIYPTGEGPKGLREQEAKLYDLIVKRFLATFADAAVRETMSITFRLDDQRFKAKGSKTIERNWHILYDPYVKLKEEEFPPIEEGQLFKPDALEQLEKQTQPPKRYTPAGIVAELEKRGLGTKATRADIVDALYRRGYVVEKSMEVTPIGMKTIETLDAMCPEIVDEQLTRHFDDGLERIREGKLRPEQVVEEAKRTLAKILDEFKSKEEQIGERLKEATQSTRDAAGLLGTCPSCGGNIRIKYSKKNRRQFAGCDGYPDCTNAYPLPSGAIKPTGKACPACKAPIVAAGSGRSRRELCINVECPAKKEAMQAKEQQLNHLVNSTCPKCGEGRLVVKNGRYGPFLGCDRYPACKYIHSEKEKKEKE